MEIHTTYIPREEDVIIFMHRNGGVFPPEEGVPVGCTIEYADRCFQYRGIRSQTKGYHSLHPVKRIIFRQMYRHGTVRFCFCGKIHWQECRRTMVVWPVELHAAGDPGTQRTDQSRFDDTLAVEKVISGTLVHRTEDPPSQFRQNGYGNVFVFQQNGGIFFVGNNTVMGTVHHGIGIRIAAGTLMYPVFRKHGQGFRGWFRVGGDGQFQYSYRHEVSPFWFLGSYGKRQSDGSHRPRYR